MGINKNYRLLAGVLAAVLCAEASADSVIALGPVEKISLDGSTVQVLGQTFNIRNLPDQTFDGSPTPRLGAYLYIEGERSPDGSLSVSRIEASDSPYVAGASEVFLAGVVSKFDQTLGLATIGGAQIYVPDASVDALARVSAGSSISVLGYQANPRQQIWATEIESGELTSIQGTGADSFSIQGTGANVLSIQGTGVNSLSIQGTGRQSIQGTGANALSIQGTGINSLSIQGTGKQSIQGTGVNALSIQGTGVNSLSIQGTGRQSIQGTGANALSIQGTGRQSIQGTGANALSIQGTGVNSLSIQGTGRQSIQGTGANALSIQGTGVNSLSIQGTGKHSIQGTG
jgi:hypothetical protein